MGGHTEVDILRERIAELEAARKAADSDLRFLAAMERLGRRMSGSRDLTELLESVLDDLLELFGCDRAWLLYPCDPTAASWQVPMERTVPEWPGALALGVEVPMDPGAADVFRVGLANTGPVAFDPSTERSVPDDVRAAFGVRSQLVVAIHPHNDKPWMLGIHHCASDHVFTAEEQRIFAGLGQRIGEALDALLLLRNLRDSERQVTQLQRMQAIGSLAGGVAHDFNNQLLVILCYAELLQIQLGEREQTHLDRILRAGERASVLTRQLLAFSRRAVLDPRPVDLGAMVAETAAFVGRAVGTAITIEHQSPPKPVVASVDPHQVEQVLVNLHHQRARRHAAGRHHPDHDLPTDARRGRPGPPGRAGAGALRGARGGRRRVRHGRGHGRSRVRALLHHQGARGWHRAGPVHRLRGRAAVRGHPDLELHAGPGQHLPPVAA